MMGRLSHDQEQFFYSFRLDEAVPDDHPVRKIAAVLDLSWVVPVGFPRGQRLAKSCCSSGRSRFDIAQGYERTAYSASRSSSSSKCHVWTAPSWQGLSLRLQACRCGHVFGLLARHTKPLAIMPSADQVPVKSSHSTMQWHLWVVLIAGSTGSALRAVCPSNLHTTPGWPT
jgi:hypothetical protein